MQGQPDPNAARRWLQSQAPDATPDEIEGALAQWMAYQGPKPWEQRTQPETRVSQTPANIDPSHIPMMRRIQANQVAARQREEEPSALNIMKRLGGSAVQGTLGLLSEPARLGLAGASALGSKSAGNKLQELNTDLANIGPQGEAGLSTNPALAQMQHFGEAFSSMLPMAIAPAAMGAEGVAGRAMAPLAKPFGAAAETAITKMLPSLTEGAGTAARALRGAASGAGGMIGAMPYSATHDEEGDWSLKNLPKVAAPGAAIGAGMGVVAPALSAFLSKQGPTLEGTAAAHDWNVEGLPKAAEPAVSAPKARPVEAVAPPAEPATPVRPERTPEQTAKRKAFFMQRLGLTPEEAAATPLEVMEKLAQRGPVAEPSKVATVPEVETAEVVPDVEAVETPVETAAPAVRRRQRPGSPAPVPAEVNPKAELEDVSARVKATLPDAERTLIPREVKTPEEALGHIDSKTLDFWNKMAPEERHAWFEKGKILPNKPDKLARLLADGIANKDINGIYHQLSNNPGLATQFLRQVHYDSFSAAEKAAMREANVARGRAEGTIPPKAPVEADAAPIKKTLKMGGKEATVDIDPATDRVIGKSQPMDTKAVAEEVVKGTPAEAPPVETTGEKFNPAYYNDNIPPESKKASMVKAGVDEKIAAQLAQQPWDDLPPKLRAKLSADPDLAYKPPAVAGGEAEKALPFRFRSRKTSGGYAPPKEPKGTVKVRRRQRPEK